jgi:hypothetical protein
MNKQSHGTRNGLICAFVIAAAMWAAYPVAEIGFIDDWAYIKVAQVFAQAGHFIYNGWESPILGWQVVWGAFFIRLFGFSFTVVRLSMLPVAMATIFLIHAIFVRFGINSRNAILGTLTVGLSPLFIPLAASYMTDVPGFFVIVLCLYLCQRAVAAESNRATIVWLCFAAATNVVGGTARQVAWLGVLVMVPSVGWCLRRRRGVLLAASLLWIASVTSIMACLRWFNQQPYIMSESIFQNIGIHPVAHTFHLCVELIGAVLCLLLVVYPILVAWLPEVRRFNSVTLLRIALITLLWGFIEALSKWTMPWLYHVISSEFTVEKTGEMFWPNLTSLPWWGREATSLLVVATTLIFLEHLRSGLRPLIKNKTLQMESWHEIFWLLGPFTLSYFLLLLPRAYHIVVFDRYLLPIVPIAIICLLKLHQQWVAETVPAISIFALSVFALLAIGGTHDWFAWERARLVAVNEVRASGVPRTEIQGGFEYDGWTQIEDGGYINEPQLKVPAGAYHPDTRPQPLPKACQLDFASYMPAIHPKYSIVFAEKMWCLDPSKYPTVYYRTWLPPYNRAIYVQRIPAVEP